jgi:hypothetical protein
MSSTISTAVSKILGLRSGNRCAFPICPQKLSIEGDGSLFTVIGEMAHIVGERPGAERYDVNMTDDQRNSVANLIYLCPTHHTQIDKRGNGFTVATITQWKLDHERRVEQAVLDSLPDVSFAELDVVTRSISAGEQYIPFNGDFTIIDPSAKMARNELTGRSHTLLTMGLASAPLVTQFIKAMTPVTSSFAERLKTGFTDRYELLFNAGVRGDDLLEELCLFASKYSSDFPIRAASLAVIGYFFEACDVFTK